MAGLLGRLRTFARTRNGKITLGGTAVAGVVGAGLLTRRKAGGDPTAANASTAAATTPSYLQTTGTSGANGAGAPVDNSSGGGTSIDQGQLDSILAGLAGATDAFNSALGNSGTGGSDGGGYVQPSSSYDATVISVFTQVVGHPPTDPAGVQYYADRLASGAITVDQMRAEMTTTTARNRAAQTAASGPSGSPVPTTNPAPAPAPPPAPVAAPPPPPASRTYTVVSGDTLSKISVKFYGTASKWQQIYNANRGVIGSDPNKIKPGQRLVIP